MSLVKKELQKACVLGDYDTFLNHISTIKKLEFKDFENDCSLLYHAVVLPCAERKIKGRSIIGSKLKIIEFLIKGGANINYTYEFRRTPLHMACDKGFLSAVKALLESGADINAKDKAENSPIFLACRKRHHEIVIELLNRGAKREDITNSVILDVVNNQDEETIKVLVESGYSVNFEEPWPPQGLYFPFITEDNLSDYNDVSRHKLTPLHLASRRGFVSIVNILIHANANVTLRHEDGLYDIHHMATKGDKETIRLLVENGACVDALSPELETPLFMACFNANLDTVQQLLECGANPFQRNIKGESLMSYTIKGGNVEIVRLLVGLGVKFEKISEDRYLNPTLEYNPLCIAAIFKHTEVFKYLVKLGLQLDEKEEDGSSVLHIAVHGGSYEITECILNLGFDVLVMNKNFKTPLHIAIWYANIHLFELLITHSLGSDEKMTDLDKYIDSLLKICYNDSYPIFFDDRLLDTDHSGQIFMFANRLKAAGLACLNKSVESIQLKKKGDKDYYRKCTEEIKLMKVTEINNSKTLYNLLGGSLKTRIRLINMPETEEILLKMDPFDKFPIYSSMLSVRLKRAIQMKRLLEIGTKFFMSLDIEPKLSNDCIESVLSFINIQSLIALEGIITE